MAVADYENKLSVCKLKVCHIITKIFLLQTLELLVLFCRFAAPCTSNDVGRLSVLLTFLYSGSISLVGEILGYLPGFDTMFDPCFAIPETLVVRNSLVDASLWILHLIDSFGGNLSHPCLKGSALEGRDGLFLELCFQFSFVYGKSPQQQPEGREGKMFTFF